MRHLIIRNLGPLKDVDVYFNRLNVVVGPQSSGKSCLLKTASYCAWVEKRIQLSQDFETFGENNLFERKFVEFHKLKGYVSDETFLMYENDTMRFSYTWKTHKFDFSWKESRWDFVCPKVSYIPAERNMVAAIPNWFEVSMNDDNIRNFMTDWETARTSTNKYAILNMGVSYKYDSASRKDKIVMDNGLELDFTNASSGLQSLIPLMVYIHYVYETRFLENKPKSVVRAQEEQILLNRIYNDLFVATGHSNSGKSVQSVDDNGKIRVQASIVLSKINNNVLSFDTNDNARRCSDIFMNFTSMNTNDVFLEEPEQNLFPPTQSLLIDYLKEMARGEHGGMLFVATHSPYVVTSFIEESEKKDVSLFLSQRLDDGLFKIHTATEEDVQEIYDYSIDVFHNIDSI